MVGLGVMSCDAVQLYGGMHMSRSTFLPPYSGGSCTTIYKLYDEAERR